MYWGVWSYITRGLYARGQQSMYWYRSRIYNLNKNTNFDDATENSWTMTTLAE